MILSPYSSSVTKNIDIQEVVHALEQVHASGRLQSLGKGIVAVMPDDTHTPLFTQMLTNVELNHQLKDVDIVIDARTLFKENSNFKIQGGDKFIPSENNYLNFTLIRAKLQQLWLSDKFSKSDMGFSENFSSNVFVNWIADKLAFTLKIDDEQKLRLAILTNLYYYHLFIDVQQLTDQMKHQMAGRIYSQYRLVHDKVMEIVETTGYMKDIFGYADAIKKTVDSSRTDMVNGRSIIGAAIGGGWIGPNFKENTAIALEHPPTFLAMVYTSIISKTYKSTAIGNIVKNTNHKTDPQTFVRHIDFITAYND